MSLGPDRELDALELAETVELVPAWTWRCPVCQAEHVERGVRLDLGPVGDALRARGLSEQQEARCLEGLDVPWPRLVVTCPCGAVCRTIAPRKWGGR